MISILAKYFSKHFFGFVYFVVFNKICSVLLEYSVKYNYVL